MTKKLFLLLSLIIIHEDVAAGSATEKTNNQSGGVSLTMLQLQMTELRQDIHTTNREITALKDFSSKVADVQKRLADAEANTPEQPKSLALLIAALDKIKDINGEQQLDYAKNPAVKEFVEAFRGVSFGSPSAT